MPPERRRIARLVRLEQVRAMARRAAATEAAEAEGALRQLHGLAGRTADLARDYARRADPDDGQALARLLTFAAGLQGMAASTTGDAAAARARADAAQQALAQAERRRAAVEDRVQQATRTLAQRQSHDPAGARKALGTALETDRP